MAVDSSTPFNTILDFPQQAGCADVLRLACLIAVVEGLGLGPYLFALLHDALYLECPSEEAETVAEMVDQIFQYAGHLVAGDAVTLRTETKVTYCPDRSIDEKGKEIWEMVACYLGRVNAGAFA